MGCDEPVGSLVARAILTMIELGWIGGSALPEAQSLGAGSRSGKSSGSTAAKESAKAASKPPKTSTTASTSLQRLSNAPPPLRPAVTLATEMKIDERVAAWRQARNYVAIGNLGEQVAIRALARARYDILATQGDLQAAVADIVGTITRMNPEDLIAVTPDNRYTTINVKATASESTSGSTAAGNLATPRMSKGQNLEQYYSTRAGLLSPLEDGKSFGQVMKVDLIHKQAQIFDIGTDGRLSPAGKPVDVLADIVAVCLQHPESMPAPSGPNVRSAEDGQGP